jgi:voltage-gated potassium channel Kch
MATTQTAPTTEPEITNYELFILILSVLSLVNLLLLLLPLDPVVHNIVLIVDFVFTAIFLADFFTRLVRAPSKRGYFLGQGGWLDLLGSISLLRIARLFRVIRVGRGIRRVGLGGLWATYRHQRAASALLTTLLAGIIVLEYASIFVIVAERTSPEANIKTTSDAVWWSYVTMTTVGYGDRYPVTNAGRLVGVVLMTLGVGLFGVLTGYLANAFIAPKSEPDTSTGRAPDPPGDGAPGATPQSEARPASEAPPADLNTRVDRLTEELRQLTQLLREQQARQQRQET